jgi:hypothetical protein
MIKKLLVNSICITIFLAAIQPAFAGFPIGQGRWLLVPTYTRYTAEAYWDGNRTLNQYTNGGRFTSNYFGLYGGYGIGRDVDLVFNLPYVTNTYTENNTIIEQYSGMGDATVGLSYFLNHFDYYKHLSVTGSIILPMYQNLPTVLLPGFASPGIEAKLGFCGTNTTTLKDTYYDLEGGIRHYFNQGGPTQFFANATLGTPLDENWKLSGTLNFVNSTSSLANTNVVPINALLNRDFDFFRGTISLGYRLNRNMSLWASIFTDFTGRSIGQGRGFSTYLVIKF